jgi:hypothetical protein
MDGINKLHDFWSSICDAPEDVHYITDDLKCLVSLLKEISDGPNHSASVRFGLESCGNRIKVRSLSQLLVLLPLMLDLGAPQLRSPIGPKLQLE